MKIFKTISTYTVANILNAAIPFLLLPFLTHYLSPEDYGLVAMFQVLISFTLPFIGESIIGAISRRYFDKDKVNIPSYVTNILYIFIISAVIIFILYLVLGGIISKYSEFPVSWIWVVVVFSFFQCITQVMLVLWQVQHKAVKFGVFRISRTLLDIGLSLVLIMFFGMDWEGRIEAQVIAVAIFAFIALYFLYRAGWIKHGINLHYIKNALRFGLPLIPHVIGAVIITYSDRLFIVNMISREEMGLYSVGYQVGMIIYIIQNSFNQGWMPWFYEKLKGNKHEDKNKIVRITYGYNIVIAILALGLVLIAPYFFEYFISESYAPAMDYVIWIALGFAFNGMYKMVVNYILFLEKTYIVGIITICTAGLNILLNYYFIQIYGAIGAAKATALSFFIQYIVVWIMSIKLYKMPWLGFFKKIKC